jgi:hypothetical protein
LRRTIDPFEKKKVAPKRARRMRRRVRKGLGLLERGRVFILFRGERNGKTNGWPRILKFGIWKVMPYLCIKNRFGQILPVATVLNWYFFILEKREAQKEKRRFLPMGLNDRKRAGEIILARTGQFGFLWLAWPLL